MEGGCDRGNSGDATFLLLGGGAEMSQTTYWWKLRTPLMLIG